VFFENDCPKDFQATRKKILSVLSEGVEDFLEKKQTQSQKN